MIPFSPAGGGPARRRGKQARVGLSLRALCGVARYHARLRFPSPSLSLAAAARRRRRRSYSVVTHYSGAVRGVPARGPVCAAPARGVSPDPDIIISHPSTYR